jgi:hypothetical protein
MATMQERALEELDARYEIRNGREVFRYLAEYPELEPVLIEAYSQICKIFGDDARASLDFWQNPEELSDVSLWVYITSSFKGIDANNRLSLLDEWFIDIIPRSKGSLNFDTR